MTRAPINLAAFVVALLVLGGAAGGLSTVQRLFSIQIQKKPIYPGSGLLLSSLPVETESWMRPPGRADALMDEETQVSLGTKNTISRPYVLKSTAQSSQPIVVELHAAYYTGMIDAVPHVPERCFVGGGMMRGESAQYFRLNLRNEFWRPDPDVPEHMKGRVFTTRTSSNRYTHLPLDPDAIRLRTTSFFAKEQQIFAGYFFIANGGTVPNAEEVRLLAFDLNSYYAYFVKVQVTSVMGIKSQEELARHAESLIGELLGDLMLCTPDWVEVEKGNYPSDNPRRAAAAAPAR